MKVNFFDNGLIVIDEFLPKDLFIKIQHQIECDSFQVTELGVDKFYLLNSGEIYKNKMKYFSSKLPWGIAYEEFMNAFKIFINENESKFTNIKDVSLKVHLYKAGAEIHWHKDWMHNASYSFFAHQKWDYRWGGNLLVASKETTDYKESYEDRSLKFNDSIGKDYNKHGRLLMLEKESDCLLSPGIGQYISPVPNRLVIIPPSLYHKVERVDHSSGHNCRVSLTGFIYNE